MKTVKLYLSTLLGVSLMLALSGCFDDPGTDIVWDESIVEIAEATTAAGPNVQLTLEQEADGVATDGSVTVNLASRELDQPVTVTYEVSGSAIEGVHYNLLGTGNTVTIPAGEFFAEIPFEVLTYNIPTDAPETLTITLTGAAGAQGVEVSANYATVNLTLRTLCTSAIPEGMYMETATSNGGESVLTKIGSNVYRLSDMNWGYYSRGYGAIFGEFTDVCDELTLAGVPGESNFGIAWIGTGSYDPDTNTLTFSGADGTYNSTIFVSHVYELQ